MAASRRREKLVICKSGKLFNRLEVRCGTFVVPGYLQIGVVDFWRRLKVHFKNLQLKSRAFQALLRVVFILLSVLDYFSTILQWHFSHH